MMRRRAWIAVTVAGLSAVGLGRLAAALPKRNALWEIVHGRCVPGAQAGDPAPCVLVEADDAVLKDRVGKTQFLLIPTARVTGIEDPALLAPNAPNYFAAAWRAKRYVDEKAGHTLPRDAVALAINPPGARSQEQLHIHIDCLRSDIWDTLRQLPIARSWTMLPAPLQGQRYLAMHVDGEDLDGEDLGENPVRLLANSLQQAQGRVGDYTLVVTGASGPGFVLLAGRIGPDGSGHGEDLQDHACAVAGSAE